MAGGTGVLGPVDPPARFLLLSVSRREGLGWCRREGYCGKGGHRRREAGTGSRVRRGRLGHAAGPEASSATGHDPPAVFVICPRQRHLPGEGAQPACGPAQRAQGGRPSWSLAGRKRHPLRIAVLVTAAWPPVVLVTACSAREERPGPPRPPRGRTRPAPPHTPAPPPRTCGPPRVSRAAASTPAGPTPADAPAALATSAGAPARAAAAASARRVTFANRVTQTIWVAAAQNPASPLARTAGR